MRTIKFRAWSKECYDEESDSYIFEMISAERLAISEYNLLKDQLKQTEKFKLMQFTGFKDINGSEIYEGDIIENTQGLRSKIIWYSNGFYILGKSKKDGVTYFPCDDLGVLDNKTIIGNIYENPELLSIPTAVL